MGEDEKEKLDYLNGRFAALEHIVLLSVIMLGAAKSRRIFDSVGEIPVDEIIREEGASATFAKGMRDEIEGFRDQLLHVPGNDERLM